MALPAAKSAAASPITMSMNNNNNNSNAVYCTHCCPICGGLQNAAILCNEPHIHLHCNCGWLLLLLALPVAIFAAFLLLPVYCCCFIKAGLSGGCHFLKKFAASIVAIMLYCCHSCFHTFAATPLYCWSHFCCCLLLSLPLPSFPVVVDCCFLSNCNCCALANAAATNCCHSHYNMMFAAPQCCQTPVVTTRHCFHNY